MLLPLLARLTAPPTQTLHTLSPTPSTISFTVSTRPVRTSLAAKLSAYIGLLTRILLALLTALLVWAKYALSHDPARLSAVLLWGFGGPLAARWVRALAGVGWVYFALGAVGAGGLVLRRGYKEESLTLLRGLGVQTSSSPRTFLQAPRTRFIPTSAIQDIFIHEAFRGFEVRFYLAIVVEGEEDVVVVFPGLLPRRGILEEVWRGARACLWEGGKKKSEG